MAASLPSGDDPGGDNNHEDNKKKYLQASNDGWCDDIKSGNGTKAGTASGMKGGMDSGSRATGMKGGMTGNDLLHSPGRIAGKES